MELDNLEKAIYLDPKWAAHCMLFLIDNPEFIPYKAYIPVTRWKLGHNMVPGEKVDTYTALSINDFFVKVVCQKYYNIEIYKRIKDKTIIEEEIPSIVTKIYKLPIVYTYQEFMDVIMERMDLSYFEPELNRIQMFSIFNEIDFNYNEDINSFKLYGLFDIQTPEPETPEIKDLWTKEFSFISGLETVYDKKFKNGYEALKFIQKWKRCQYIGYILCLSI